MRQRLRNTFLCSSIVILSGCAAPYFPIDPPALRYFATNNNDGIEFSYQYGVLETRGNTKYFKRENKKNIKMVAVKLTNNTNTALVMNRDLAFYSGDRLLHPLDPLLIKKLIKQPAPVYLLYLLLTPLNIYTSDGYSTKSYPVGLILGPAITIRNIAVAGKANANLEIELTHYDLMNKEISSGQTVYGIIGLSEVGYDPITVRLINN